MRNILDFILYVTYMVIMWVLLYFSKFQELYFMWRKIPYKHTNEGLVVRIKQGKRTFKTKRAC